MKVVGGIDFGVFSPEQVRKMSAVKVTVPDTYDEDGYPINNGLADQHLGVIDPGLKCKNCGGRMKSCSGHFGHIELVRPVVHVGFAKYVYNFLKATCRRCSRLLNEDSTIEKPKTVPECQHCGEKQGKIKLVKPTSYYEDERRLLPNEVRERLEHISDEDLATLDVKIRPEWAVLTVLIVPPVTVRPSITLETGERSEDDLTHKLVDILRINQRLGENIDAGAPQLIIEDLWELLQYHVATFFDNETAGIPPARHRSGRQLKTLFQRLKGKEGRFRYNLSGKRVNFSARTVISPDPTLGINELGVPEMIAKELTVPVKVTEWNAGAVKKLIKENPERINYIIRPDGKRKKITALNTEEVLAELAPNYVVERQLMDGDSVIFNRQPSLHRVSMMAHNVRVLPGKTFRFNAVDCRPYNADYDGDEMNIHVPQTEEAQAEASTLMRVQEQVLSPRNGEPIIVPELDHISGLYLLTSKGVKFDRHYAFNLLAAAGLKNPEFEGEKANGRELFSSMLPPEMHFETHNLAFSHKCSDCKENKCDEHDSTVVIKKGKLMKGFVDGRASDRIVKNIFEKFGSEAARSYLDVATKVSSQVVADFGLSLSLDDYEITEKTRNEIEALYQQARENVHKLIRRYRTGRLQRQPGKSLKETLEERVMEVVEAVRRDTWDVIRKHVKRTPVEFGGAVIEHNSALLMADSGARGKPINVVQMAGLVGQQAVRGKRIRTGFKNRILTHFNKGDLSERARGFVRSSYVDGLDPIEYFFHAAGGRDSVVDKGVNPAKTGYMQRRLVNALQDLIVQEDYSVSDSEGRVIQFKYGDDGVHPDGDRIAYGEPVGVIAAQSIGEPGTQMSASFDEKIIVKINGEMKVVEIGEFVDGLIGEHKVEVLNDATEWCDMPDAEDLSVPSLNQSGKIEWKRIRSCSRHWHKDRLLRIRTKSGREIKATANHSFVTRINNRIVPIAGSSLKTGDRLPVLKNIALNSHLSELSLENPVNAGQQMQVSLSSILLDEGFGWFVGAYLSEGCLNRNSIQITNNDENFLQRGREFGNKLGIKFREVSYMGEYGPGHDIFFESKVLARLLLKHCSKGSYNKRVPEFAYSCSDAFIGGLLRAYFDGDGNINFERGVIRAHSRSKVLIDGISLLLNRLGIFARKKTETKGGKELHVLHISKRYANVFKEKVGFDSLEKAELLDKMARLKNKKFTYDSVEMVTGFGGMLKETARKLGLLDKTAIGAGVRKFSRKQKIGVETLRRYVELFERVANEKKISVSGELDSLKSFLREDVVWDEIVEIEHVNNDRQVYDLSVSGLETFTTADGIVTHNTLRTFHYAGVASLAQLGFTRLVEIVDATRTPKSPVMEVYVKKEYAKDFEKVKKIAAQMEQLTLEQVADVKENFDRKSIRVVWDEKLLREKGLREDEIIEKLKEIAVCERTQTGVTVKPKVDSIRNTRKITNRIRELILRGVPNISRAIIIEKAGEFTIATEGSNLAEMLKQPDVDASRTTTNDVMETYRVLGVEAARNAIINEMMKVLEAQGLRVSVKHIMLIADAMTNKGEVTSVGRHGLAGEKASVLARAAFEETAKHLLRACVHGEEDKLRGVAENIIIGQTIPCGTGKVKVEMEFG